MDLLIESVMIDRAPPEFDLPPPPPSSDALKGRGTEEGFAGHQLPSISGDRQEIIDLSHKGNGSLLRASKVPSQTKAYLIQEWNVGEWISFREFCDYHGLEYHSFRTYFQRAEVFDRESRKREASDVDTLLASMSHLGEAYVRAIKPLIYQIQRKALEQDLPLHELKMLSERLTTDLSKVASSAGALKQIRGSGSQEAVIGEAQQTSIHIPPSVRKTISHAMAAIGEKAVRAREEQKKLNAQAQQ